MIQEPFVFAIKRCVQLALFSFFLLRCDIRDGETTRASYRMSYSNLLASSKDIRCQRRCYHPIGSTARRVLML